VEDLSLKEVSARLARHLLELHGVQRRDRILLSMPKRQLANTLGTVSETLSRTLAKMKTRGVIDVDGREVAILDIGELEELAMGKKL
jgi:CRP/FNR family transcriptional regulator